MRQIARRIRVSSLLTACALALGFGPRSAGADAPPVAIGEVSAHTPSGEFSGVLRSALEDELAAQSEATPRKSQKLVLSAKLVKLSAEQKNGTARATAVVSVVLRRARDSTLQAILSGSATAEEEQSSLDSARDTALRAAVRGALRGLPKAVAQR